MFNSLILKNPTNVYKRRFPSFLDDSWFYEDAKSFLPKANIIEKEKEYLVEVEVPGVKKEDVDISVKDNVLTVRGEKKKEEEEKNDRYYSYESSFGSFEKSWTLEHVEQEGIDAKFKDGVLVITLPKKKEVIDSKKPKKISIK